MFKKVMAMVLMAVLLVSCANDGKKGNEYFGPSKTAYDFLLGFRELDAQKMSDQLAVEAEKLTQKTVDNTFDGTDMTMIREVFAQFLLEDIKISNEKIDGDKAMVDVTLKTPQEATLMKKIEKINLSEVSKKEMINELKQILKEVEFVEQTETIYLEKVGSGWKMSSMEDANSDFVQLIEDILHNFGLMFH